MKILFITPSGGRTGSEMMIWYYLDYLKDTPTETIVYSKRNGELLGSQSPADFTYSYKREKNFVSTVYEGVYNKAYGRIPEVSEVMKIHEKHQPDFWYINTIALPEMCLLAKKMGVPYVLHVHELPTVYEEIRYESFGPMFENARQIIGCSAIVEQRIREMGYQNTVLLHSFIDTAQVNLSGNRDALRHSLGIPADAFVWGMSGGMNLRKGYDMLPQVLEKMSPDSYFVWLGRTSETGLWDYVQRTIAAKNLNFIHIPAKAADYYDYLNILDGFALLSREDPFPLVMLEAAYLQKPLVGFDSGGIAEFMQEGMGRVAEGFSIPQLTAHMKAIEDGSYVINKETLRSRALEFEKQRQMTRWYENLQNL